MPQTITVDKNLFENILAKLAQMTIELKRLRSAVEDLSPEYGSEAWWDKETKKALEEVKKGNYKTFDNAKDMIKELNS